VKVVISLGQIV